MKRLIALAVLPLLAACGSSGGENELMRRVAQAEEAAIRAEASAKRAEAAAAQLGAGSSSSDESESSPPPAETVVEDSPDQDTNYGKGEEPVPLDG